jgi:hypothetical protein
VAAVRIVARRAVVAGCGVMMRLEVSVELGRLVSVVMFVSLCSCVIHIGIPLRRESEVPFVFGARRASGLR